MIKTFAIDDEPFTLVPEPVLRDPTLNIFAADSMTLLVGPNGSGKTRLLLRLAEVVASDAQHGAQIEWARENQSRSTFALYFTPIPFANKVPPNKKRFAALHPVKKQGKVSADVETAVDLAEEFGLDALPALRFSPYKTGGEFVKTLLFHPYRARRPLYQFSDEWIAPLARLEAEQDAREAQLRKSFRERGVGLAEMLADNEWRELRRNGVELSEYIIRKIEESLGDEATLKIRAFNLVRGMQPFTKDVRLELLRQLGLALNSSPSKDQRKARERFRNAVSSLRQIRRTLGLQSLHEDEINVSLEQWRTLSALDFKGLAELSITRASSGAAALLDQFATLKHAIEKISENTSIRNLLLLIDEGDAFLHLEWQQAYVNFLDISVRKLWRERFDSVQIVLTTHSPVLMSDFPKDCIHRLRKYSLDNESAVDSREISSFGAPLDAIIRNVGGAGTLGMFSARIMRQLLLDIENGVRIDRYRVEMIDDPIVRRHVIRIIDANQAIKAHAN